MDEREARHHATRPRSGTVPVSAGPGDAPWLVVDERIPWPGFSRREWDRLLLLRELVWSGQISEWALGAGAGDEPPA